MISRFGFKSECFNISFTNDRSRPYFASTFADKSLKIWDIEDILTNGKGLEEPACVVKNAVELGPVEVQVSANRVGVSSMDSSLKIYEVAKTDGALQASLLVDSNVMDQAAANQPYDAEATQYEIDPWRFCFNPKNNSQLITGQLNLQ